MKFLCLACDDAMKLQDADRPETGDSISAVFACPKCGNRIAMLTNAYETQVVESLGVRIGPEGTESKCPFSGMIAGSDPASDSKAPSEGGADGEGLPWTAGALERLENVPEMVRPMARQGIELWARQQGVPMVTEKVMEQARGSFGM